MKPAPFVALVVGVLLAAPSAAVEYTVSTCADLADVDDTLATGLTIDSTTFACDEYTRFRVRNTMSLKATGTAVEFSNFSLKVLGELTVEPDVTFTGVVEQVKNGGVLYVAEGATATFMGASEFSNNSVAIKQIGPITSGDSIITGRGVSYIVKKGGAIHNKGMLTFDGDATFLGNYVETDDSVESGRAGAVSNSGSGSILFKGKLTVKDSDADGVFAGLGGGFFNRGNIVVDGESYFEANDASDGGAIYQTKIGTMTFNAMATFFENRASELQGGAIYNEGVMDFNDGSLFEGNVATGSGDGGRGGAIYNANGGVITLTGSTTFKENSAFWGGAIFNDDDLPLPTTTFPDDTIFVDNEAEFCPESAVLRLQLTGGEAGSSEMAFAVPCAAVEYTVSTCADLADVDDTLATGLTIDSTTFACDEYTRFRVRNTMSLKATGTAVKFSNFSLKVLGELTVEPDVTFTGVVEQVKNGGVLYVAEGATANFMGASEFSNNSVAIKDIGPIIRGEFIITARGVSYIVKKGGAIHNKGMLTFDGDATFLGNYVETDESEEVGKGGAVSNSGSGSILFKGKLTVKDSDADGVFAGLGGGFFNRGNIVVDGESYFEANDASDGGAIYQTKIGTTTFNAMATFFENRASELQGGAIYNEGVMDFNAGSLFEDNAASGSGDGGRGGAIYNKNGGVITLTGSTTFKENSAFWGGAIFNDDDLPLPTTTFPDDTIFVDNEAEYCPEVNNGDANSVDGGTCSLIYFNLADEFSFSNNPELQAGGELVDFEVDVEVALADAKSVETPATIGDRSTQNSSWELFLQGGLAGASQARVQQEPGGKCRVLVSWKDGHESEFSTKWLRDHSAEAFNTHTHQREVDTYAVPNDLKVRHASVVTTTPPKAPSATTHPPPTTGTDTRPHQALKLSWSTRAPDSDVQESRETERESSTSTVPLDWLRRHCTSPAARDLRRRYGGPADGASNRPPPVLWGADVFSSSGTKGVTYLHYDEIVEDEAHQQQQHHQQGSFRPPAAGRGGARRLVDTVRSHGIALVRGVPTTEAGTEALALKVGGHLRSTLYGPGMWATSAEASAGEDGFRDSAYSSDALALHTDCGYLADPPGIQVFNCVVRAEEGGASMYIDGFAVAERLRSDNPKAFEFFSRTPIAYQCFDEGCHYMAEGPVFRLGAHGQVVQVRHNDYDRAPLDYLSNDDVDRFYEYHKSLSAIIRDPSMVARILLEPGECVIVDNQRAMHGREAFKGKRRMVGCYLGMDELHSAARVHAVQT
eukprot:g8891.t1